MGRPGVAGKSHHFDGGVQRLSEQFADLVAATVAIRNQDRRPSPFWWKRMPRATERLGVTRELIGRLAPVDARRIDGGAMLLGRYRMPRACKSTINTNGSAAKRASHAPLGPGSKIVRRLVHSCPSKSQQPMSWLP